jgi:hypothetical protein
MIPKVDHYIGRKFVGIRDSTTGEECQWAVELDGNVLIRNYDEEFDTPSGDPTGLSLIQVKYTDTSTELLFGNYNPDGSPNFGPSIMLSQEYTIASPEVDEIAPQEDHTTPVPEDPSPERVVTGPEVAAEPEDAS